MRLPAETKYDYGHYFLPGKAPNQPPPVSCCYPEFPHLEQCDPTTDGHQTTHVTHDNRASRYYLTKPFKHFVGLLFLRIDQNEKFFATVTITVVVTPQCRVNSLGNLMQYRVTHQVAMGVVDFFKVIDVTYLPPVEFAGGLPDQFLVQTHS